MASKVYSFVKVRKKRTQSGFYALIIGIESLLLLVFLILYGIYRKGNMSGILCMLPYISWGASGFCLFKTYKDRKHMEISGKYLDLGYKIVLISVWIHLILFLLGILMIIL